MRLGGGPWVGLAPAAARRPCSCGDTVRRRGLEAAAAPGAPAAFLGKLSPEGAQTPRGALGAPKSSARPPICQREPTSSSSRWCLLRGGRPVNPVRHPSLSRHGRGPGKAAFWRGPCTCRLAAVPPGWGPGLCSLEGSCPRFPPHGVHEHTPARNACNSSASAERSVCVCEPPAARAAGTPVCRCGVRPRGGRPRAALAHRPFSKPWPPAPSSRSGGRRTIHCPRCSATKAKRLSGRRRPGSRGEDLTPCPHPGPWRPGRGSCRRGSGLPPEDTLNHTRAPGASLGLLRPFAEGAQPGRAAGCAWGSWRKCRTPG